MQIADILILYTDVLSILLSLLKVVFYCTRKSDFLTFERHLPAKFMNSYLLFYRLT